MPSPPATPRPRYVPFLDGLRGVLALYVLGYHAFVVGVEGAPRAFRLASAPFRFGHSAVGAFIVLSGFSLMLPATATGTLPGGLKDYLRRRARRILPTYYAALAFSMLMLSLSGLLGADLRAIARELSLANIASHLLLVHNLIPGQGMTINGTLWSVATEWQIYFFFPLLLLPALRRLGPAGVLAIGFGLGLIPQLLAPGDYLLAWCPWYLGLFAMGMLAAVSAASPGEPWRRLPRLAAVGVLASIVLKWAFPETLPLGRLSAFWLREGAVGLIFWGLIGFGAGLDAKLRADGERAALPMPFRWLEARPAVALGSISYSLYATHLPILNLLDELSRSLHLGQAGVIAVRALVGLPVSIAFAAAFATRFEWPFLRRPSQSTSRSAPAQAPAPTPVVAIDGAA